MKTHISIIRKKEGNWKLPDKHNVHERTDVWLCRKPTGQERGQQRTCGGEDSHLSHRPGGTACPRDPIPSLQTQPWHEGSVLLLATAGRKHGARHLSDAGNRTPETHLQKTDALTEEKIKLKLKRNLEWTFGLMVLYFIIKL